MESNEETTHDLLLRIRQGDGRAQERLLTRFFPALTRWAHGKLPLTSRDLNDTADLVQMAMIRALQSLPRFDGPNRGAFYGFLRTVLQNLLRDEIRKCVRRPAMSTLSELLVESSPTPFDELLNVDSLTSYDQALQQLDEFSRHLICLRIEYGYTYEEMATALGLPSANATRMRLARAVASLATFMKARESG